MSTSASATARWSRRSAEWTARSRRARSWTVLGADGTGKSSLLGAVAGLVPAAAGRDRARRQADREPPGGARSSGWASPSRRRAAASSRGSRWPTTCAWGRRPGATVTGIAADRARVLELFPVLGGASLAVGRHAVGRPASRCSRSARSLMSRPRLLLLDEPSLGLAADRGRPDLRAHRRPAGRGHHHPAGRAERPPGSRPRRPRLRARRLVGVEVGRGRAKEVERGLGRQSAPTWVVEKEVRHRRERPQPTHVNRAAGPSA